MTLNQNQWKINELIVTIVDLKTGLISSFSLITANEELMLLHKLFRNKITITIPCKHWRRLKQHLTRLFHFWLRQLSDLLDTKVVNHSITVILIQFRILYSFTTTQWENEQTWNTFTTWQLPTSPTFISLYWLLHTKTATIDKGVINVSQKKKTWRLRPLPWYHNLKCGWCHSSWNNLQTLDINGTCILNFNQKHLMI